MKKFFRFCGGLALSLVILGLVFWGVGMLTVGSEKMNEMVQKLTNGKINMDLQGIRLFDEDVKVKLGSFLDHNAIYDIDDSSMFSKEHKVWENNVERMLIAEGDVTKLNLELGGCMFELADSTTGKYYVEYRGKGKTQAYADDGTLYVKVLNGSNWNIVDWNNGSNESHMILYLPMNICYEEIRVDLGAGQMNLDNLSAKIMEVEMGAGQVVANGLTAENLTLRIGAGEALLEESMLKDLVVEVGAGNCEIAGKIDGNVKADCAAGNIAVEINGNESDFNYDIQCAVGKIRVGDIEYSGLSQEQELDHGALKEMELTCAAGNLEVAFQ